MNERPMVVVLLLIAGTGLLGCELFGKPKGLN